MINLRNYLAIISVLMNNNGLVVEHPNKPLQFVEVDGEVVGLEANRFRIKFMNDDTLDYGERGVFDDNYYKVSTHQYHFNPKTTGLHPYRIDLDKIDDQPHANHYDSKKIKYDNSWPDHLYFPTHISLDISEFNLVLALNTALMYISRAEYPLDNRYSESYNTSNNALRRRLK